MSKRVQTPSGPLAPKDNPNNPPLVGLYHQYPPVDLVDPETHLIAEGDAGGKGQAIAMEIVSPNELKRLEVAGRKAAVEDAFQKIEFVPQEEFKMMGVANMRANVQDETRKIELVSPGEAKALKLAEIRALVQHEIKGLSSRPAAVERERSPSAVPRPGIGNWIEGIEQIPEDTSQLDKPGNYRKVGMSTNDAIAAACEVKVEWDILDGAESYTADTRELALMICANLNRTLSDGKDSIAQAVAENNMADANKLLEAAEFSMMVDAEGYSRYESFEPFRMLPDPRIGLKQQLIADLGTITGAILAAGPGTKKDIAEGDWPLILDSDSWYRFAITCLANIAKAGARFKDFPARGNHSFDTEQASFALGNELERPATQAEMMRRLLEQIYSQMDERNDGSALDERAKALQEKALNSFEWLIRARVALKSVFLGQYFPEEDVKAIMEQILLERPKAEIMEDLRGRWAMEVDATIEQEGKKIQQEAEFALTRYKAQVDAEYAEELEKYKSTRRAYYDGLDQAHHRDVVTEKAIAWGLIEPSELRGRDSKKAKTSRASSIVSLRKRGRSVSRAEDLAHVNLVSYSSTPSTKAKDGSITPTRSAVDVPVPTSQVRSTPTTAADRESFPPLVQPSATPSVMQVDVTSPPIIPTPPALADNPVVKPTTPPFRSGLATSMHAPGNVMDTTEDPSPSQSTYPEKVTVLSDAQKAFEDKIEARLSSFETQLLRIAELITGFTKKPSQASAPPPMNRQQTPVPRSFPKEVVAEVHKLREQRSLPPGKAPSPPADAVSADLPSADTSAPGESYASSLGKRAKVTMKKRLARDAVNANVPGSAAFTGAKDDSASPNTHEHVRGHINVNPPPRPMFSTVTAKAVNQGEKDRPFMKAARKVQKTPMVTLRPGATSSTEITIIRRGGVRSEEEELIRNTHPKDIVHAVRQELNKATSNPPVILSGRWSTQVQRTGNFVFTIHGIMDAHQVEGISKYLCEPFPGECYAVPSDGWMWVHLRGVPTASFDGVVYNHEELAKEVFSNECFQGLFVPGPPSWLQHPAFVQTQEKATVMMAYVDRENKVTNRAKKETIVMFGRQVQFVPVGDKPIQYQCSRCWAIGHRNKECRLVAGAIRCFICGKSHHGNVHNYECSGKHVIPGVCSCAFKCLVCGGADHHAASPKCPKKAGVQITKEQWRAIMKRKEEAAKDEEFNRRTKSAPQAARSHHKGKAHTEREWTPAQREVMEIAAKVIASPCANDESKTRAGCACCKPPALDYVEAIVRNYPYPTPEKMEELMTSLPEAADRISELVLERDLASAGSQPTAEMSSSAEPFPTTSLERRTKARPAYKGVTARVDDANTWGAEDTPSDEERIEEMMCEEMGESLVAQSQQSLAAALSGYKDPESIKGWD